MRAEKPAPPVKRPFKGLPEGLAALANEWLHKLATYGGPHAKNMSPNTVVNYAVAVETFSEWLEASGTALTDVKMFDGMQATAFINWMVDRNYRPRSISVKRAALKSFWNHLASSSETTFNPFDRVDVPVPRPGIPRPFTDEEDAEMLPNFVKAGEWGPALLIMRFAGLRKSEALDLSPADITESPDGKILRIHVMRGKGGKERWAAMLPLEEGRDKPYSYQDIVWDAATARAGKERMFEHGDGRLYSTCKAMIAQKLLPEGFTPHRLRHTFATWLRKQGCKEDTISELLGHTDVRTMRVYASRRPENAEADFLRERRAIKG